MKAGSSYKMSKQSKRLLATIVDKQYRSDYIRFIVDAEISGNKIVRSSKTDKRQEDNNGS